MPGMVDKILEYVEIFIFSLLYERNSSGTSDRVLGRLGASIASHFYRRFDAGEDVYKRDI